MVRLFVDGKRHSGAYPSDCRLFVLDAFTERPFAGNPAAVCVSDEIVDEALMQLLAGELNLSETAFLRPLPGGGRYALRWFTPTSEVDLCGHATLASGAVVLTHLQPKLDKVTFETRSGPLGVARSKSGYVMDFPELPVAPLAAAPKILDGLERALGKRPAGLYKSVNLLAEYLSAADVRALHYRGALEEVLDEAGFWGLIATARGDPGTSQDFVSRFFAPKKGIPEDPVTGSAHCALAPFWGARLGRSFLTGYQASARGGLVRCELKGGGRVGLEGHCVEILTARLSLSQ
ncbi:MAG: PhzF family phenazine biosynthesis protein [Alphaproteobacteria bacterium]|nr:PhzF family phenazine biosynthesis protein [Alphaproteobacteria bacterium]